MPKFQRHLFICTHERDPDDSRGCCSQHSSAKVASAFKKRLHDAGFRRIVRANKSGCLDQCDRGTTIVVYPDNVWYGGVTLDDVDEIIEEHIRNGRVVERLQIPDDQLTGVLPETPSR